MSASLERAVVEANYRWMNPSPDFSSGMDRRSSDNALLGSLYGGLYNSTLRGFQNAGRVLVDRTDVRILFEAYQYELPVRQIDQVCRDLDVFVRQYIYPRWGDLQNLSICHAALVDSWLQIISEDCMGHPDFLPQSRCLLMFLCPMLPVSPKPDTVLNNELPHLQPPLAEADAPHIAVHLQRMLDHTDWWQRRVCWQQSMSH